MARTVQLAMLMLIVAGCAGPDQGGTSGNKDAPGDVAEEAEGGGLDNDRLDKDSSAHRNATFPGNESAPLHLSVQVSDDLTMTAHLRNAGNATFSYFGGCGQAWSWRILGPDGNDVPLQPQGSCDGGTTIEVPAGGSFVYEASWDGRLWHGDGNVSTPPSGNHTWKVTFDDGNHLLQDEATFRPGPTGELTGFVLTVRASEAEPYEVDAWVENRGTAEPNHWSGCLTEWRGRVLHEGQTVHSEPQVPCAGFSETTFPPGHVAHVTWDAEVTDRGHHQWEITFRLRGADGPTMTVHADFWPG